VGPRDGGIVGAGVGTGGIVGAGVGTVVGVRSGNVSCCIGAFVGNLN
jgi:hypothetical protein